MNNNNIQIVEYNSKLAASVATMWNNTKDGWNGHDWSTTTENVLIKEDNSTHKNLFLAVDAETINDIEPKVVGYCKLTKDHNDENALYIGLLSVLPEYFSKKVGKALMLQAVERTIELNYPRLYLYTWSGNTRAVPLYKKCGFFWEQNAEVHLVNMIPSVMKCEAVSDFFKTACWYNDSIRVIEIEPDGRLENKFEYYTYNWEKEGRKLEMEYCQRGKGLRKIDCDDYAITATVSNRDLIFGKKHRINYEIINKSGKPLEIELEGVDDKNVKFGYKQKITVVNHETLTADFKVTPIDKPQNPDAIHPVVFTRMSINGKIAEFKTGIVPKYPVSIDLNFKNSFHYNGEEGVAYINLRSFCDENCTVSFDLGNQDSLIFAKPLIDINLKPLEKKSITVNYNLNRGGYYNQIAGISVKFTDGQEINFLQEISEAVYTRNIRDYQVTKHQHIASLGKYSMCLVDKDWGCGFFFEGQEMNSNKNIYCPPPCFGKPYSDEFNHLEAEKIFSYDEGSAKVMRAYYNSLDFPGLGVTVYYRIYPDGILEKWLEITNNRDTEILEDLTYCDQFRIDESNLMIPYQNQIIKLQNGIDDDLNLFDFDKISENWLYSKNGETSSGITWPKEYKITNIKWSFIFEHNFAFEHNLKGLKAGRSLITKPITAFLDLYDLEGFRKFVAQTSEIEEKSLVKSCEVLVNNGNPFVSDKLTIELKDYRNAALKAELTVCSANSLFSEHKITAKEEDKLSTIKTGISFKPTKPIEEICCKVRLLSQSVNYTKKFFPVGTKKISLTKTEEWVKNVYAVDNGVVKFKASPDFAPTLYSLVYNGNEWSDSSFPQTISKCWWTPWYGGLTVFLAGISEKELLLEEVNCEFVTLSDNFKNCWQGLKITVKINKKEELKGLSFEQYFLTLPQSPVVVNFNKVINNTGRFFSSDYNKHPFYKVGNEITNMYWEYYNRDQDLCSYYLGYDCTEITVDYDKIHSLNSDELADKILFFYEKKPDRIRVCSNAATVSKVIKEVFKIPDGEAFVSGNEFMIFTDENMNCKELSDLQNIKFEI